MPLISQEEANYRLTNSPLGIALDNYLRDIQRCPSPQSAVVESTTQDNEEGKGS